MQFELHLLAPVCNIRIIDSLHKYSPRVCVVFRSSWRLWVRIVVEEPGCCAVDEGAEDLHALYALLCIRGCHLRCYLEVSLVSGWM
jgi:hypothetical protein